MQDPVTIVASLVFLWLAMLGAPAYVAHRYGRAPMAQVFTFGVLTFKVALACVGIGLLVRVVSMGLSVAGSLLTGGSEAENASWIINPSVGVTVFALFGSVIVAPVLEELFFRGLITRALAGPARDGTRYWVSVAVTSVLFGASHLTSLDMAGLLVAGQTTLMGVVLAIVNYRVGLLAAMVTHISVNASGVALLLVSSVMS